MPVPIHLPAGFAIVLLVLAVSFVLSALTFPLYIRWLKRKQIEQFIREEGPQSHAAKAKTPTMGGLCFIAVSSVVTAGALLFQHGTVFGDNPYVALAALVTSVAILCGLVGFADDFAKVTSKSNAGLSATTRLLTEFFLGAVLGLCICVFQLPGSHFAQNLLGLPDGTAAAIANLIYLFGFIPFLVAATANALNLHDGMDGLAAGTSLQVFVVVAVMLLMQGKVSLAFVAASLVGSLAGFLLYNRYPAKVFMGDTGSLFIGGGLAALVVAGDLTLWFIPLVAIYIAETLSVIIQVVYFKLTKEYKPDPPMSPVKLIFTKLTKRLPGEGKRYFKMAPLHHHFEALAEEKGVPEWKVVANFWLVQFAICAAVLVLFRMI